MRTGWRSTSRPARSASTTRVGRRVLGDGEPDLAERLDDPVDVVDRHHQIEVVVVAVLRAEQGVDPPPAVEPQPLDLRLTQDRQHVEDVPRFHGTRTHLP